MTNHVPQAGSEAGHRLFLGLEMPAFVQEQLADLRTELPGVRWQWPADLHLTLRFLGSVPERLMAHIIEAMQNLEISPFDMRLSAVGTFDHRVLWAGTAADADLQLFRHRLDARLLPLGFEPEQLPFSPHVTLARTRGSRPAVLEPFLAAHQDLRSAPWTVTHFSLFRSERSGTGPVYQVVARFALGKGAS